GCLSKLLGVKTINGLRYSRFSCLRSTWKKLAGCVQLTTCMLFSAHSSKKRSIRADECSGPWPSKPCGRSMTSPFDRLHFVSALDMYWSMMICAPLKKSPNCASQIVSAWGLANAYPYSKPKTPYSDKWEL